MQSTGARAVLAVALIALAVVLFVVLSDGDEDDGGGPTGAATRQPVDASNGGGGAKDGSTPPAQPQIPTVAMRAGQPVGGVLTLEFTSGDRIRFRVRSDEAGEVHVHGYEIIEPIAAGASTTLAFPADLQGGYEVEVHGHQSGDVQVAELIVNPG
jgi:hypothetical protein